MDTINIRDLQHFLYCQHRWGLITIDNVWAENIFVIKAILMHENVHDTSRVIYSKDKKQYNGVSIYNDELGIFGVTDSLIIEKNRYSIIEHKPTKPKICEYNVDDALQVFAQKICVDSIFNTNSKCYLYYRNEKSKIELPFEEEYDIYFQLLKDKLVEMRKYLDTNQIPSITKGQKCTGCSLKDICMPSKKFKYNLKKEIMGRLENGE